MRDNLVLRPSSAARRIACPGSRELEDKYPQLDESEQAFEGKIAHECAKDTLLALTLDNDEYTKEMIEGANLYASCILSLGIEELHIEEKLKIPNVHDACEGTPDCWGVKDGVLYVFDYKFGHRPVDAYENAQLLEYAAGALLAHEANVCNTAIHTIQLIIVQPRDYISGSKINDWTISRASFECEVERLSIAEHIAAKDNAQLNVNALCNTCAARHVCSALQVSALEKAENAMRFASRELNSDELGNELRYLMYAAKILDARITGLSEVALSNLKNGVRIPHFLIDRIESRETWKAPVEKVLALGELYGVDLSKNSVVTPHQAAAKGFPAELVKTLSERRDGKPKLLLDDCKKAKKAFNKAI